MNLWGPVAWGKEKKSDFKNWKMSEEMFKDVIAGSVNNFFLDS